MVQCLLITHGELGKELVRVAERILEKPADVVCVAFQWQADLSDMVREIDSFVRSHQDEPILVLTDMFGGSPANLSMKYLSDRVEILTGVNLPGLLKFLTYRDRAMTFPDLVRQVQKGTVDGVSVIGDLLGVRKDDRRKGGHH